MPGTQALTFKPPLDAQGLLAFFGRRAVPGVESVDGDVYQRSLRLAHGPGVLSLTITPQRVEMDLRGADPRDEEEAIVRSRALLDLDADPAAVDAVLAADPLLAPLVRGRPGRRVPGPADPFELAVRAVLGQQVTVAAAVRLATRLVADAGPRLPESRGPVTRLFPGPDELLAAGPSAFAMPAARREALRALARAWPCRDRDALLAVPGVGPWTADYVAMRSGYGDAMLANDAALRREMGRLPAPVDPDRWRPYRAYAVLHLWDLAG
jgi:AraC family transcriptional regulator of adaptative response / DNA-3-methyladenine glycosylase II